MMNEEMLGRVSRPSRYVGEEINAVHKDHGQVDVKVALAFPDTYEIGMSHMGLKILYDILNRRSDTVAERVYAPWKDMEEILRSEDRRLSTIESGLPLRAFDMVGFTLQYEMSYTNILNMLDLAGIPLWARERKRRDPLIIGGGPCAFNPEPLADFFDCFALGDGEELIHEIVEILREYRHTDRQVVLKHLATLEGIYVPGHFEIVHHPDGSIRSMKRTGGGPCTVEKRIVRNLDEAPFPCAPLLPYMKTVHDRVTLEISRGCTQGCRFCQAGIIYRPVREREPSTLLHILEASVGNSGHEETSLASLSAGDYTALEELVGDVVRFAEERHVSVSLPSLRPGSLSTQIIKDIRKIRKTGFTIAPEAGTQRLRDVINKKIREEDILDTVTKVFDAGWETLKLYFMIGLPTETEEDLSGIVSLVYRVLKAAKASNKRFKQINVSVSPFVPKPHTPFQWCAQDPPEEIRRKYGFLKQGLKHRKINFKWHEPGISLLEGVFARGDRRLSAVLHQAWLSGCRFDGWTEEFKFDRWLSAFEACRLDPSFYVHRERHLDEAFPWDHLESGISKDFLAEEYRQAHQSTTTPDCRDGICTLCGVCDDRTANVYAHRVQLPRMGHRSAGKEDLQTLKRFRIRYTKVGKLRFLSHLELISLFARAFVRAGIPLAYSQGFHPHPKIAMGPALPVGVSSLCEFLDVTVAGSIFEETLQTRLNGVLPRGIEVSGVNWIPLQAPAISSIIHFSDYRIRIPRSAFTQAPGAQIEALLEREEICVTRIRKGKEKVVNLRPMIADMVIEGKEEHNPVSLSVMIQAGDKGGARVDEVLQVLLNRPPEEVPEIRVIRTGLYLDSSRTIPFQENIVQAAP
ncbi:MAG: TIGR03960 family B12-binding radical SAM protein [bacterium]|nr:TIGR03960 family B12-binding radical SAM protein [bacterium]